MRRLFLGVLGILGTAACDPYNAPGPSASPSLSNDPPSNGVRISGYGRFGVSVRSQ